MEPMRVLHVITGMGSGGAEAFIMNIYRNIDTTKVQFDFLLRATGQDMYFPEIEAMGGRIFITPSFPKEAWGNYVETKKFFAEHQEYDVIHVHGNALIYMTALVLAKQAGIKCRIMHSHNTKARKPLFRLVHETNKQFIGSLANAHFACSQVAGEWMFKDEDFQVVNNAIAVDRFSFNEDYRKAIRAEFNLDGKFVVGHIGRFLNAKNHAFIVKVFAEIQKREADAVLLLVGTGGPLEGDVRNQVKELGLEKNVIFTGERNDVYKLIQAMDVLLFPSIYEGLPVTLVEAQASGLVCFISENITAEVCLTDLVKVKSLETPAADWATAILAYRDGYERKDMHDQITAAGYNMQAVAKELEQFYLSQSAVH